MKKLMILVSILILGLNSLGGEIAKVDLEDLEQLIIAQSTTRKGNEKLLAMFLEHEAKQKEYHAKLQKDVMSGNFDPMKMAKDSRPLNAMELKKKFEQAARAELILIVEELYPNKYDLILNESYRSNVLYTAEPLEDITQNIKQYLLKKSVK